MVVHAVANPTSWVQPLAMFGCVDVATAGEVMHQLALVSLELALAQTVFGLADVAAVGEEMHQPAPI